jgi:N-acetylglucosaminyldiphosphoundecaprenol N-acetyl-beta-D-mannosaminyltransferase
MNMNDHTRTLDGGAGQSSGQTIDLTGEPSRRVQFMGVPLDALTMDETVNRCRELAHHAKPTQHVVLNAAKMVTLQSDDRLRTIIKSCGLVNADGMAVVWAARLLGLAVPERVAGIDLFVKLVEAAATDGDSVYFLGAEEAVVQTVARVLKEKHPTLQIAGLHNGFWTDDSELIAAVREAKPTYLFLAIPSPRKEYWLNQHLEALGVPFVMGVGGSFDVVAGKTSRAPIILQKTGLEWTWRLIQEPRRMFKRYLKGNTAFIKLVLQERKKLKGNK